MSYDNNPYYYPEKLGLTIVGEIDNGGGYDFDLFVVWEDAAGNLYWADDSGCSCPTPFEMFDGKDDLSSGTSSEAIEALLDWGGDDHYRNGVAADVTELAGKLAMR